MEIGWTEILLVVSLLFNVIIGYAAFNIRRKYLQYEDAVLDYYDSEEKTMKFIAIMQREISDTITRMNLIDKRGMFKNEDEVGIIFSRLHEMINKLNKFLGIDENVDENENKTEKEKK